MVNFAITTQVFVSFSIFNNNVALIILIIMACQTRLYADINQYEASSPKQHYFSLDENVTMELYVQHWFWGRISTFRNEFI